MRHSRSGRIALALAALAGGLLAWASAAHPGLRMVDFLSFASRAQRLAAGQDLLHPLYPVGYPAALLGLQPLFGDALAAGRALSIAAGMLAVYAAARWLGAAAGLWLLAQAALLQWGASEGTDLPAAALALAALAAARRSPALAGALLGAALLTRYTAIAALPSALLLAQRRGPLLLALALATIPHWGMALALDRSPLPDQGENLMIGGHGGGFWSLETLRRLPEGLVRGWHAAAGLEPAAAWPAWLGAAGLLLGMVRRDRRAFALALWALLHLAGVGIAFVNPRLALPAALAVAAGARWLLGPWLAAPAAILLALNLPRARDLDPSEESLAQVVAACAAVDGPFLSTSPWFHQRRGGWPLPSVPLQHLGGPPQALTPDQVRAWALANGFSAVAVETGRLKRMFSGLGALGEGPAPPGYALACEAPGWRVYTLTEAP